MDEESVWPEWGVEVPEKWEFIWAAIVGFGAIILGFWYWSWMGALGGWILARWASKLILRPYMTMADEEE